MVYRILENKIFKAIAGLSMAFLLIGFIGLFSMNGINIVDENECNNVFEGLENMIYSCPTPPINITLSVNQTPVFNESFNITSSVKSSENISEACIYLSLPYGIKILSGNLSWSGILQKDNIQNLTVTAKIDEVGCFSIYSSVLDKGSFSENVTDLYFYANTTEINVYDHIVEKDYSGEIEINVTTGPGESIPGSGGNIAISGTCTYAHYYPEGEGTYMSDNEDGEWENITIKNAKVRLYRLETSYMYNQTAYTDNDGYYLFAEPVIPGEYKVKLFAEDVNSVLTAIDKNDEEFVWSHNKSINASEDTCINFSFNETATIEIWGGVWEIYHYVLLIYDELNDRVGWTPFITADVKISTDGPSYGPEYGKINIPWTYRWKARTIWHEFAHFVMDDIAGIPSYQVISPHYRGLESSEKAAFVEGWAEFLPQAVDNNIEGPNGSLEKMPITEYIDTYADSHDKGWDGDIVEGAVAAAIYDIYDETDSSDYPRYSFSKAGDEISDLYLIKIWDVMVNTSPDDIHDFWDGWNQCGYSLSNIWSVFYNQRINKDSTPPTLPNSYLSSIPVNEWWNNVNVTVSWSGQDDEISGIYGYSISWTENEPALPDDSIVNLFTNETTESLFNGTWYLNIRPVDRANNSNNDSYSVGPFKINNSDPILTPCEDWDNKTVQPEIGTENTNFSFKVHYYDNDEHEPKGQYKQLIVDGDEDWPYVMNGSGWNSDYTTSVSGYDLGFGVHSYYFNFTDVGNGTARLPAEGDFSFNVTPNTPEITGPEKVHPSMYTNHTYTVDLSNYDSPQNFFVKIDIENNHSRLLSIDIPNGEKIYLSNTNTSGWFECTSGSILICCQWPIGQGEYYFLTHPGDYTISVISKHVDGDTVFSETGNLDVNVNIFNWKYNPFDIIWAVSTNGPYSAQVEEEINLTCSMINGTSPSIVIWDFGDDSNVSYDQNISYYYYEPGYYQIICTMEDSNGTRQETYTYAIIGGVKLTTDSNVFIKDQSVNFTATLYDMEPSSNHWYVFSTGHQVQDSDVDGIASITTSFSESGNHTINVTLHNGGVDGPIINTYNLTITVIPFIVDAGGPYAAINNGQISFEGVVYYDYQWISTEWDFGDGEYGYGLSTTHTYDADENTTYNVTLNVTIWGVGTNSTSTTATIYNLTNYTSPEAELDEPICGNINQNIEMDGRGSTGDDLSYFWKIGNGVWEENDSVINRTFSDVGDNYPVSINIKLKVVDQYNFSDTTSTNAIISELQADFSWSPSIPNDLNTVSFNDQSAPDGCNYPDDWYWDFGDSSTSTEENPQHQYDDDGYYYVKLKAKAGAKQNTVTKRIYIDNVAPEAGFNISPLVAPINEAVSFNCTSTDSDGEVALWERFLGDGDYSYSKNTSHNYSNSGFYSVTTYIMDDDFDQDSITKDDQLLIADAIVSKDFNESSFGYNVTRFDDFQKGIDAVSEGGILVVLNDSYSDYELKVNKSMDIYAIQNGYNKGDTEIQYGDVVIECELQLPIFNITASNVTIKGFTLNGGMGIRIEGDYVNIKDCTVNENSYGIICENSSHINIFNTNMSGNEACSITLTNSDNVTIQDTEISYSSLGVFVDNSVDNSINSCNISEIGQGIQLVKGSDDNTIQGCSIHHVGDTAILINNSIGNIISDCKITDGYKGVEVVDVDPDNQECIIPGNMLNIIQDTDFTNVDYGVYLYNSSHTRVGKKSWSFNERDEGLYLIYYHDETAVSPMVPFPSTLDNATSLFAHNDYSIYIDHSDYNVVDGIAIAPVFSLQNGTPLSCQDGISICSSDNNVVASCLIQNVNYSAINITDSLDNTVCLCMLKENQKGITAESSDNNMFIGCSFFNNTFYGIELMEETMENSVMYNDFVYNNQSYYQAYDIGDSNLWDDDGRSFWRDLIGEGFGDEKTIGNFWSDYNNASFSENGTGMIPSNRDSSGWLPTGETAYNISGSAKSQDHAPILESVWAESWYVGDYPWIDPEEEEEPYLLPPIPYQ